MSIFDKVILNGTTYTIPSGGGGGTSYTAGAGIDITENVITNTREQRVLIDEDDDSGLHSGFIVKSPHWYLERGEMIHMVVERWNWSYRENTPKENGSPYSQTDYFIPGLTSFYFSPLVPGSNTSWTDNGDGTYTKDITFYANDILYIDGVLVTDGTASTHTVTIGENTIIGVGAEITMQRLRSSWLTIDDFDRSQTYVNIYSYLWSSANLGYIVHNGTEAQLVDDNNVASKISANMGSMYAGKTSGSNALGSFAGRKTITTPDDDFSTSVSGNDGVLTLRSKLSNSTNNLTVGFDQTYNEQQTVTHYSYQEGIDTYFFFGYLSEWYGSSTSFVGKTGNDYYIEIPMDNVLTELAYSKQLVLVANGMDGEAGMALTINNSKLVVKPFGSMTSDYLYTDEMGNCYLFNEFMSFIVNGETKSVQTGNPEYVLLNDVSTLTSLAIMPTSTGISAYQNGCFMELKMYQGSSPYYSSTLWPYEATDTVQVPYQNHPEKLNHYIRYAGETGTTVANRKAYILTDKNISQSDYIAALVARIAALEARLDNYDGTGMTIESQYPGQAMSGVS